MNEEFEQIYQKALQENKQKLISQKFNLLQSIQALFYDVSDTIQDIFIPYLLESKDLKLTESEKVELSNKNEDIKVKLNKLVKFIARLLIRSSKNDIAINPQFVNHIDHDLYETVRIFEDLDKDNEERLNDISNTYSAYIMGARLLNTALYNYKVSHSNTSITLLHNIPDPQIYEIDDVRSFLVSFIKDLNTYLGQ